MEEKLLVLLTIIIAIVGLLILWNDRVLSNILKMLKNGEKLLPDERYFELKAQNQYMIFGFSVIIIAAGIVGYDSVTKIQTDVISENIKIYKRTDSLINARIDKANEDIGKTYKEMTSEITSTNSSIKDELSTIHNINHKIGVNNLFMVSDFKVPNEKGKIHVVLFKNLGLTKLNNPPAIFVEPKGKYLIYIENITKESFEMEIGDAKVDTVRASLIICN